ncbi:MAG: competence/damage-inducible protein A [Chloroflexi bacterium]|jgi:competence/damage-inducible protein CinA-like protein|nr:competence/damage-inducible protein A [Chloroflexota bacterium]
MAVAEIVTIGTELLLGEIHDTNSKFIALALRNIGIDLYRLTTVGDNVQRITFTLQEALMRADIVITTGGLGPTLDDPTRQAVADTFNVPLVFNEELWQQILERFKLYQRTPSENNKRQAYIPTNAIPIRNEVGTAPAFAVELGVKTLISLPGVPREMEHLMNNFVVGYLKKRYGLQDEIILPWVVHTVSLGESSIDEIIGEMEKLSNPTVGLVASPGQTDVRVTAKAHSAEEAQRMMEPVLAEIRKKLGKFVFGENEDTIQSVVASMIQDAGLRITVIEAGTDAIVYEALAEHLTAENLSGELLNVNISHSTFNKLMKEYRERKNADLVLGLMLNTQDDQQELYVALLDDDDVTEYQRIYAGPPGDAKRWALNVSLDLVRNKFIEED